MSEKSSMFLQNNTKNKPGPLHRKGKARSLYTVGTRERAVCCLRQHRLSRRAEIVW